MMKPDDYAALFNPGFSLDPGETGLLVIDMQYATACRTTGLGKLLKESGQEDLGSYRFDRIEDTLLQNTEYRPLEYRFLANPTIYSMEGFAVDFMQPNFVHCC